jgi:hypothetical protein
MVVAATDFGIPGLAACLYDLNFYATFSSGHNVGRTNAGR